jgi:DNA-binding Xre family transcriptional regulator
MIRLKTKELIAEKYAEQPSTLDLAYELGVSMPTAKRLMDNDLRTSVTIDLMDKLCEVFGVQPDGIFEHTPKRKPRTRRRTRKPRQEAT